MKANPAIGYHLFLDHSPKKIPAGTWDVRAQAWIVVIDEGRYMVVHPKERP